MIDLDQLIPGQSRWKWEDAVLHRQWKCSVFPTNEQYSNIIKMARILEWVENRVKQPLTITDWLRVPAYNVLVGGSPSSAHMLGMAVDFVVFGRPSPDIRQLLIPELDRLQIRMENKETVHVHIDVKSPGPNGNRFFVP